VEKIKIAGNQITFEFLFHTLCFCPHMDSKSTSPSPASDQSKTPLLAVVNQRHDSSEKSTGETPQHQTMEDAPQQQTMGEEWVQGSEKDRKTLANAVWNAINAKLTDMKLNNKSLRTLPTWSNGKAVLRIAFNDAYVATLIDRIGTQPKMYTLIHQQLVRHHGVRIVENGVQISEDCRGCFACCFPEKDMPLPMAVTIYPASLPLPLD